MLPFDQDFQEALRLGSETDAIRRTVRQKGIKGLLDDGFEKVKQGLTTLEEVLRVAV